MIKRISLLVLATMLVATMAIGAVAAPAFADCVKERGTWTCTTTTPGKNAKQPKFEQTTTTTTQGNLSNFSPEPQGTGTKKECTGDPCPPGQFK